MSDESSDESRANFTYFSNEYAQALQAYTAIENQASTLLLFGSTDELFQFIDQFLEMATRVRQPAIDKGEPNFAEWFGELIEKASQLRHTVSRR